MQTQHPKYKIKKGDTLQSISKRFGIKEDIWKRYHNNMCRLTDVIRKNIPAHLTELFLLPELWDKAHDFNKILPIKEPLEQKSNQNVEWGWANTLPMKVCPETLYYDVMLALLNEDKVNTIKYEISIRWIGKENKNHSIELNKISNTYINDEAADLVADELAVQAASTLYPLELIVTQENGIIGVNNSREIEKRWEITKQKIRAYHTGETLEKYLRLNDHVLRNKEALLKSLSNDWFLHAYFNKIYQSYGPEYLCNNKVYAPFIFNAKGVEYKIDQTIDKQIHDQGFIKIKMHGKCCDERSQTDLKNKLNFAKYESKEKISGTYDAQYSLESKYHTIDSIMLHGSLYLSNPKKVSIVISRIKKQESL